jgi:hypothetical protein
MAEPREADRPLVTPADAVGELFGRLPVPGKDVVWLADELVAIVQHVGSVSLQVEQDEGGSWSLVCRSTPPPAHPIRFSGRGPLYMFRPLLARLAKMASEETATEFQPYGGRYTLTRSSRIGPVRLDVEFTNTPASQRLCITRTLVARASAVLVGNGTAPPPQPAEPTGA